MIMAHKSEKREKGLLNRMKDHLSFQQSHNVPQLHIWIDFDDECIPQVSHKCQFHFREQGCYGFFG